MDDLATIDAYIAALPEPHRTMLARVRALIREVTPDSQEVISYQMPGFRLRGKLLLSYAAYKGHCALYPASGTAMAALGKELAPFVTEKATIRFTAKQPLPEDLLRRYVEVRIRENAEATAQA